MKNLILLASIVMFLFKTGNVLSDSSIFNVNNIKIDLNLYKNKEKFLNIAFKKGFLQLADRILLKQDKLKIENIDNNQIKKFISYYQINEESAEQNTDEEFIKINLAFDKEKLNNYFYQNNILYTDLKLKEVGIFPLHIKNDVPMIYSENFFYDNWNKNKKIKNENQVDYIIPVENLESIEIIKKHSNNFENIEFLKLFKEYDLNNKIFIIIFEEKLQFKIFFKGYISKKRIIKSFNYPKNNLRLIDQYKKIILELKHETIEIIKSNNLIDIKTPSFLNLKLNINKINDLYIAQKIFEKIDLIEKFNVIELNKKEAKIKIKYFGKTSYIAEKFFENGIKLINENNEWKIEII